MVDGSTSGSGAARVLPEVELVRLDAPDPHVSRLRAAALRLRLAPGQRRLVGEAVRTLPLADADPQRTPFAVVHSGTAVGFGILDRGSILAEITDRPSEAVLLRGFYVAARWQGDGIGRAACAALDPLVHEVAPTATTVLLTVDEGNTAAFRAYHAAGFEDTGIHRRTEHGARQRVLRRAVRLRPTG